MTLSYKKVPFYRYFSLDYQKMLQNLVQNKLLSIDPKLEKDRFKGPEMRELNSKEKFTPHVLSFLSPPNDLKTVPSTF